MRTKQPLKWYLALWRQLELSLVKDSEFCKELSINRKTSFQWRKQKLIPFLRIHGRVYYRLPDVLNFVRKRPELYEKMEKGKNLKT